jgi:hypothetical protein
MHSLEKPALRMRWKKERCSSDVIHSFTLLSGQNALVLRAPELPSNRAKVNNRILVVAADLMTPTNWSCRQAVLPTMQIGASLPLEDPRLIAILNVKRFAADIEHIMVCPDGKFRCPGLPETPILPMGHGSLDATSITLEKSGGGSGNWKAMAEIHHHALVLCG